MKGVTIIEDKAKKRRYMQIDMKVVKDDREWAHDLLDLLIAESRRDQKRYSLDHVVAELKRAGKL